MAEASVAITSFSSGFVASISVISVFSHQQLTDR